MTPQEQRQKIEAILAMPPAERHATEERLAGEVVANVVGPVVSLILQAREHLAREMSAAPQLRFRTAILDAASMRLNAAHAELSGTIGQARQDAEV